LASRYGRAPAELFDACTDIAVGTVTLAEYSAQCTCKSLRFLPRHSSPRRRGLRRDPDSTPQRTCILSRLAIALGVRGAPTIIWKAITGNRSATGSDSPDPPPQRWEIFTDTSLDAAATTEWTDLSVQVPAPTKVGAAVARRFTSVLAPAVSPFPERRAPKGLSDLPVLPAKLPPAAAAAAMPEPSPNAPKVAGRPLWRVPARGGPATEDGPFPFGALLHGRDPSNPIGQVRCARVLRRAFRERSLAPRRGGGSLLAPLRHER
jgi:hypothetical protein